jgi:flagellar biosynthesis GTPase FlhF
METLGGLIALISILLFFVAIIGLIYPKITRQENRKSVLKKFLLPSFLLFILAGIIIPSPNDKNKTDQTNDTTTQDSKAKTDAVIADDKQNNNSDNKAIAKQENKDTVEAEQKVKEEQEAKDKAEAEQKAKEEQEAKDKAEAEQKAKKEQEANTNPGEKKISSDGFFGCADQEFFEKLVGYIVQKDMDALKQGLALGMTTGQCTMFKKGEKVFLADTAIFSGLIKLRRQGSMTEYWTNIEATK